MPPVAYWTKIRRSLWVWLSLGLWLVPAALLLFLAAPRLMTGLAIEAAFPVPTYTEMGVSLPKGAYERAFAALAGASDYDGATRIERAEMAALAVPPSQNVIALLDSGLSQAPGLPRGWVLLAEQLTPQDPKRAAAALELAFNLGPFEYYIAARRARAAAALWEVLPENTKRQAARQTELLWTEPQLRGELLPLLAMPNGAQLVNLALRDRPDQLRALNRWIAALDRSSSR